MAGTALDVPQKTVHQKPEQTHFHTLIGKRLSNLEKVFPKQQSRKRFFQTWFFQNLDGKTCSGGEPVFRGVRGTKSNLEKIFPNLYPSKTGSFPRKKPVKPAHRRYDVCTTSPRQTKQKKGIRSRGTLRVVGIADTTVAPHLVPSCSAPPLPDVPSVRGSYCGGPQAALPSKRPPDVSSGAPERGSESVPRSSHPLPLPARVSDAHASVKTEAAEKSAPAIKISRKIRKYKNAGNGIEPDFCKNTRTKNLKIPIPFECKIRYHKVRKPDDTKCRKKPELKML